MSTATSKNRTAHHTNQFALRLIDLVMQSTKHVALRAEWLSCTKCASIPISRIDLSLKLSRKKPLSSPKTVGSTISTPAICVA